MRLGSWGGIMVVGERKTVPVSMDLFIPIAGTAFLVGLAVAFVVFSVKYIRGRVEGRGPFGMFAQPRHTFAQYDDEGDGGDRMDTEGGGTQTGRGAPTGGGGDGRNPG
jgi:hypothetical protein